MEDFKKIKISISFKLKELLFLKLKLKTIVKIIKRNTSNKYNLKL